MSNLTHKELTKHFRSRLAQAKIPARVRMVVSCGNKALQVITPTYDFRWASEQLEVIARIARVNGLTFVRGLPVTEEHCAQMTEINQFDFYLTN